MSDNVIRAEFGITVRAIDDLAKSGLVPQDMNIRGLEGPERASTNTSTRSDGYVIPYFSVRGTPLPFYRIKILDPHLEGGAKYKQPRKTPNHIYFPPSFYATLVAWCRRYPDNKLVIITEGEKKASLACKMGIPTVALGGVDSWKSKTIVLPSGTELSAGTSGKANSNGKIVKAKLPNTEKGLAEVSPLAEGFHDLIDLCLQMELSPYIIFDSDSMGTLKADVARAATMLGYEFRFQGIPSTKIKQVILPDLLQEAIKEIDREGNAEEVAEAQRIHVAAIKEGSKTALDDYLMARGAQELIKLLVAAYNDRTAFPRHPNPKGYVNTKLENQGNRRDCITIASIILAELDARGIRMLDASSGDPFYYDGTSHELMPAVLVDRDGTSLHRSQFGTLLYKEFGLSANDRRVLNFLASQFTGEAPVQEVQPRRVIALLTEKEDPLNPEGIVWQAGNSQFFEVSPDPAKPLQLHDNGSKGVLFEQGQVEAMDTERVMELFEEYNSSKRLEPWWVDTVWDTNIGKALTTTDGDVDMNEAARRMKMYASLLFYISPFLQRWRGTQLPVELMIGEAGSGKSSLYSLRLAILTGRSELRNLPTDIRDWQASVGNAGGMHVTDNVHFTKGQLKQQMSDEICRVITEPKPVIEMRKLFTNTDQVRVPVTATFALTAISMPFSNTDILQRAAVFEAAALGKAPDGDWVSKQLETHGGREAWIAHQLVFLHRFLRLAQDHWDPSFHTTHRLAHYEQALTLACKVFGLPADFIGLAIQSTQAAAMLDADWTLSGLKAFVADRYEENGNKPFKFMAGDVNDWAAASQDYHENSVLVNARRLGKYMSTHRTNLRKVCGITQIGTLQNRQLWKSDPADKENSEG